jgi:hypothetical protein
MRTPTKRPVTAICVAAVCALTAPALGQWVNVPQAGTPRTADGKPDLTAPVQRTPDRKTRPVRDLAAAAWFPAGHGWGGRHWRGHRSALSTIRRSHLQGSWR